MAHEMMQDARNVESALFLSDYRRTPESEPYGEVSCSVEGFSQGISDFELIPVRRGLVLTIARFKSCWDRVMDFQIAGAPLQFEYWLSGTGHCEMEGLGPSPATIQCRAGNLCASYIPDTTGRCISNSDSEIVTVGLQIDPLLLHNLVGDAAGSFPDRFRLTSEGEIQSKFSVNGKVSPAMHSACHQIITCPFNGTCRDLFLESKVLELLSLQVDSLSSGQHCASRRLNRRDTDRIHEARDILVSDLKNPPTIALLARKTGVNETKLKAGFRTVFGTTIFDYLRRHKMEVARIWLEEGEKNVSEAAYDVGYANVSHFIKAYRTIFGVNPGDYVRRSRVVM